MDNLKEKIRKELLQEVDMLGFYICAEILDDYDMREKLERSDTIGERFASLLDYDGFNEYIEKTPEARAVYFKNIKDGIVRHWDSGLDEIEDLYDELMSLLEEQFVELTAEEADEIQELIENQSA